MAGKLIWSRRVLIQERGNCAGWEDTSALLSLKLGLGALLCGANNAYIWLKGWYEAAELYSCCHESAAIALVGRTHSALLSLKLGGSSRHQPVCIRSSTWLSDWWFLSMVDFACHWFYVLPIVGLLLVLREVFIHYMPVLFLHWADLEKSVC